MKREFKVTLTFDNGPDPVVTPQVLDVLRTRGVAATFFVLGEKLEHEAGQALIARASREGHWIGNHTYTHVPLGSWPGEARAASEICRTQDRIGTLAHPSRLFRPTGGDGTLGPALLSAAAAAILERDRYSMVLWNAVPRDWLDTETWPDTALAQCLAQPHTVLVLHDLATGAMAQLDRFIVSVQAAGGQFEQSFPETCVPLFEGCARTPLTPFITQ
ncbi:MAG: polysaccharide deacetylase family protein [Pseudomonadota bacterium]